MQHNRAGRKLRRTTSHRLAMFSNQLASLMTHERIETTLMKAKELRPLAEKLITTAKSDGLAARRRVQRWIPDRDTVKRVFETIAPRFVDRPGGYTRILRLGNRRGDNAEVAILEFVDFQFKPKDRAPKKESLSDRARRASGGRVETVRKQKEEGEEGAEETVREAKPRKEKPPRSEKKEKAPRQGPRKGPSRTGPSKRGTS
ncbi:MAG: 50S ribosomal protein L17 [Thermoanaerobaculia bacterium]|nr:50S ribosomal protein L17 [Thermoanaerobaculia bacterium]